MGRQGYKNEKKSLFLYNFRILCCFKGEEREVESLRERLENGNTIFQLCYSPTIPPGTTQYSGGAGKDSHRNKIVSRMCLQRRKSLNCVYKHPYYIYFYEMTVSIGLAFESVCVGRPGN